MAKKSEEHIWLDSVKRRLIKYISNPKWDYIELSDLQMGIVMAITNCENVNNLSPSINERVTDKRIGLFKETIYDLKVK